MGTVFLDTATDGVEQKDVIEVDAGDRGLLKVEAEAEAGREEHLPKPGDTVRLTLMKDAYGGDIWKIGTADHAVTESVIFLIVFIFCTILFSFIFASSFSKETDSSAQAMEKL